MKDPRAEKLKTRTSIINLFFQDPKTKELFKTQDLAGEFSHYVKSFAYFKKVSTTFDKKFWRKRKKQYHL